MTDAQLKTDNERSAQQLMLNALKEIKALKRQLMVYEKAAQEPIAVIGMGCRYPGQSVNPQAFWRNLVNGVDCITQQNNNERWNMDDLYDPDPEAPGKIYSKGLGIIERPDLFDAEFFGISPREAEDIDPQHRILLEVCHEAIEDAGYAASRLSGSRTGVFAGIASSDYAHLGSMLGSAEKLTPWQGIGNAASAAPGRIAYLFNLKGPALGVDTACSSSLIALHYACQSLRNRECDMALSGGVHLVLNPAISIVFAKARMLSADGYCKTFDAAADGYVRSEGCGAVMLKRLSDAERDGDHILALIRGSAINQDGKSQGFTAPNETAQEDVIKAALQQARLQPNQISYIEAHGTGTPLGDPIELNALNNVYCKGRDRVHPLLVGSAKTNMGHSEAAAGMGGFIKLVLSLQNRIIPPHLHFKTPNPYVPWGQMAIKVTDTLTDWNQFAAADGILRGGVSSFAFTGTNAHVIVEEYKAPVAEPACNAWSPALLLTSARQPEALSQLQDALHQHVEEHPSLMVTQIARTCAIGRDHYKYRSAFLPQSRDHLLQLLGAKKGEGILTGTRPTTQPKIGFLFPGQGSEFAGMGKALYENVPVFREHLDLVAGLINPLLDVELTQLLWGEHSKKPEQTRYTQPALFALEHALAKTWMQWGIKPDCMAGHSVGEVVAACIAGVFSLADACKIVCLRARLMDETAAEAMEPALKAFADALQGIAFNAPRMRIFSNLDGEHPGARMASADYWVQQIRKPVAFMACAKNMIEARCDMMLEVGPGAGLTAMLQNLAAQMPADKSKPASVITMASLQKNVPELEGLTRTLAQLYVCGLDLNWHDIMPAKQIAPVQLPTYPFQRKSYWNETLRAHMEQHNLPTKAQQWLYRLQWQSAAPQTKAAQAAHWLLLFPDMALADAFANHLPRDACRSIQLGTFHLLIDEIVLNLQGDEQSVPADGAASLLLHQALDGYDQAEEICLVLSLASWPLHNAPDQMKALTAFTLSIAKTLLQHKNVTLRIITESACPIHEQAAPIRPDQALVLGFAKNMMLELADRMHLLIDVDHWGDDNVALCAQAMTALFESPWIGLRQQQFMAPKLQRLNAGTLSRQALKIKHDGVYLIAGGTGAIGLQVGQWLIERGARHLALISRSGAVRAEAADCIQRWQTSGVQVQLCAVDLADRVAVDHCLQRLRSQHPLRGIVHAAGQFELAALAELSTERCATLMANKVLGLQWLDELTCGDDLDLFAAFSSIASVWGSAGNFHYSAANQVVDAIIQRRHQQGKPALTINWGPWADSGMVSAQSAELAMRRGLQPMDSDIGIAVLGRLLDSTETQIVVADIVWQRFKPVMTMLPVGSLFSAVNDIAADSHSNKAVELNEDDIAFKNELAHCPIEERSERLLIYLRQQLARALQLDPHEVDDSLPLIEMGIDSLLAVEFRNRVTQVTEVELPIVRLLGGANLRDVAQWMADGDGDETPATETEVEEEEIVEGVL